MNRFPAFLSGFPLSELAWAPTALSPSCCKKERNIDQQRYKGGQRGSSGLQVTTSRYQGHWPEDRVKDFISILKGLEVYHHIFATITFFASTLNRYKSTLFQKCCKGSLQPAASAHPAYWRKRCQPHMEKTTTPTVCLSLENSGKKDETGLTCAMRNNLPVSFAGQSPSSAAQSIIWKRRRE
jgi:hypothetical protein